MIGRLIRGTALAFAIGGLYLLAARLLKQTDREQVLRWYKERPALPRQRVVILGAGFGGLYTTMHIAEDLQADPNVEIVLVDRHNFHLFTPLLTAVASGLIDSHHVAYPVRRLERHFPYLFREAEVESIDLENRKVLLSDGPLGYDFLVLALGSETNYFGMSDVQRLSLPFKSIADAIRLRNRVIDAFERAAWESDPDRRQRLLTFVFCGAGATGIELVATMNDFIFGSLLAEHPSIREEEIRLILIEAQTRVLPALDSYMATVAHNKLLSKGIDVRLGTRVAHLLTDPEGNLAAVETRDGERIATDTCVWTAGIQANSLVSALPLKKGKGGAIAVDDYLSVPDYHGVYALGDNASVMERTTGRPLPPDAKVAVQLARWVARNIANEIKGQPREAFQYEHVGDLVSLGANAAVAEIKGVKVSGFTAFLLWRSFYFWRLLGFESKARVAWDYLYGLFAERDTAKTEAA